MVHVLVELDADEFGPHEWFCERITLPPWYAASALEAHAGLLTLIATTPYFELPEDGGLGGLPLQTATIRRIAVWEA